VLVPDDVLRDRQDRRRCRDGRPVLAIVLFGRAGDKSPGRVRACPRTGDGRARRLRPKMRSHKLARPPRDSFRSRRRRRKHSRRKRGYRDEIRCCACTEILTNDNKPTIGHASASASKNKKPVITDAEQPDRTTDDAHEARHKRNRRPRTKAGTRRAAATPARQTAARRRGRKNAATKIVCIAGLKM